MKLLNFLGLLALVSYISLYFLYYPAPLFSPLFAGNDARQQLFPLYTAIQPEAFEGDLIYRAMRGYLAPLHLFISEILTLLTRNPIMTGHWVMMIQLSITVLFLFLLVRRISCSFVACFTVIWLFSSPNLIRNFYGGLPRGWAGAIIASFLYYFICKKPRAVLLVITVGCLLHPHSTFLIAATYSLYFAVRLLSSDRDAFPRKAFTEFVILCPLFVLLTLYIVKRPPEIGQMVSYQEASAMPAFNQGGRFPFLPFDPALEEIRRVGFRAFMEVEGASRNVPEFVFYTVVLVYALIIIFQIVSGKSLIKAEFIYFLAATFICYFLARLLAFRLYVPVRYLNWPLGIFFVCTLPTAIWRLFHIRPEGMLKHRRPTVLATLFLILLGYGLYYLGGSGIGGRTNFKPGQHYDNPLYTWFREHTEMNALIAGHPTQLDGLQLYSMRKAYVTSETAHPFYKNYYDEMERRTQLSFKALYSRSSSELRKILDEESIDYFVFSHEYFKPKKNGSGLRRIKYYKPFDSALEELMAYDAAEYFYFQLVNNPQLRDAIVYRDEEGIVIEASRL